MADRRLHAKAEVGRPLAVTAALVYNRVAWRPRQASGRASHDGVSMAGVIGTLG